jgi:polysaccharide biosynthesis protein PslH
MMIKSICVVVNQRPFPPFHGANADIWRIMRALRHQGVAVHCVSWKDVISTAWAPAELYEQLDSYLEFEMSQEHPRLRDLAKKPGFALYRELSDSDRERAVALARDRGCEAVLSIGLYAGQLGADVAERLGLPFYYRSQAIETEYFRHYYKLTRQQARQAGYYSHYLFARNQAELRSIASHEANVLARARKIFEISCDDLRTRAREDSTELLHLPPLAPTLRDEAIPPSWDDRPYDIGYLGNLFMPNNQKGLLWFTSEVLPIIRRERPFTRVLITGKVTDPRILPMLSEHGVDISPNPVDAHEAACSFRVGVNPIFEGNGTTVKTLDLLWAGCGVVTTPIGVQGYGFESTQLPIRVATNAGDYAKACLSLLSGVGPSSEIRSLLEQFTMETGGALLANWMSPEISSSSSHPGLVRGRS